MLRYLTVVILIMAMECGAVPKPDPTNHGHPNNVYPPGFPTPTETYIRYAQLDHNENYFLFWKTNDTHIQFETHVKTKGYVGFGISHHGSMYPADIVIGWVKDGTVHFKDRHTIGFYEPIIDKSQDWELLAGYENDFGTVLKFSRAIDTCDEQEDLAIEAGTTKVIYSYHPEDPIHETGLTYHGENNRGAKSLLLLDTAPTQKTLPADVQHFDFINNKFHVPAQQTFYHCTVYKLPDLPKKHHVIMYEPIIQKGHEGIVHHMLVYICPGNLDPKYEGKQYECYRSGIRELHACSPVFLAWAVGGGPFFFPDNAGFSVGEPGDPTFLLLETHYNNPTAAAGFIDSSGLRMYYTPTLRQHDAGMLMTGSDVDSLQIVPPEYESFISRGYCSRTCMNKFMSTVPNQEVYVFANFLHTHLLGSGIKTRIVRNGTELAPILEDNYYDFDYQEVRTLPQLRTLKSDDFIITECDYNSKDKGVFTYGGFSTSDEMCLSFLVYYPKMPLATCLSVPMYNMYTTNPGERRAIHSYLQQMDWKNETVRDMFQKDTDESIYSQGCRDFTDPNSFVSTRTQVDQVVTPYVKPRSAMCTNN